MFPVRTHVLVFQISFGGGIVVLCGAAATLMLITNPATVMRHAIVLAVGVPVLLAAFFYLIPAKCATLNCAGLMRGRISKTNAHYVYRCPVCGKVYDTQIGSDSFGNPGVGL